MTTAQSPDNAFLVLDRPRVLGATLPVVDAEIGVSLVIYDLVIDGLGATVNVDPPLSGTVDPGDVIELWLEGDTTFLDSEIITDVNAITTLRIPKGRLQPDRFNLLFYTILRGSQNIGTSLSLIMLYNKIRPGLKDTRPEIDGHSELALLLPDEIRNGVGADFVSAQVCVSYPYCRAHDTITLKCNGEIMTHQVRADEAPQPPNPGSPNPITACFTVTRAYLERAIRPGGKLDFSYTVTDQLGNTPDTDAVWSASQTVDEDLAGTRLKAPILLERMEDYPGDDSTLIELEKLAGGPLLVIVITTDHRFLPGDTIEATYTAKVPGQPVDVVVPVSGVVEADPFGQKKPCILQVPNDKVIAQSAVTMVYTLKRGGAVIATSATAVAQVVGEATIDLKPPSILQAPNNTSLEPLAAEQALTAIIPPEGLLPTDLLSVIWTGPPGTPVEGSHTTVPRPISEIGLSIALPTTLVAFSLGQSITVRYEVTRGSSPMPSDSLTLLVVRLPASVLGKPLILQAANDGEGVEFDVSRLTANAVIRVNDWPFIALKQYIWLRVEGTNIDDSRYSQTFWQPPHSQTNETWIIQGFYTHPIPFNELKNLKDGSELKVEFKAGLSGSQDEAEAQPFQVRTYAVKAVEDVKPEITTVTDSKGVEIAEGGTTVDTSVTLTGTASKGQKVQVLDGTTPKGQPTADATTGIWTLTDTGLALGPHSFTAKALYGSEQTSAARTFEIKPFVSFEGFQSLPEKELFLNEAPLETPALFLSLVQFQVNGYAVVARFPNDSFPGKLEGNCIQGSGARVRLELKAPCSQVSFWQWTVDCTAVIYGVGGEILGEESLGSGESVVKSTFTFSGIKRIELIFRRQYCIVDTFSFSL